MHKKFPKNVYIYFMACYNIQNLFNKMKGYGPFFIAKLSLWKSMQIFNFLFFFSTLKIKLNK